MCVCVCVFCAHVLHFWRVCLGREGGLLNSQQMLSLLCTHLQCPPTAMPVLSSLTATPVSWPQLSQTACFFREPSLLSSMTTWTLLAASPTATKPSAVSFILTKLYAPLGCVAELVGAWITVLPAFAEFAAGILCSLKTALGTFCHKALPPCTTPLDLKFHLLCPNTDSPSPSTKPERYRSPSVDERVWTKL